MNLNEYQQLAGTTAVYPGKGDIIGLCYVALGLGEAGELQGKIKKVLRDDNGVLNEEKRAAIVAELGDVLWYVANMATELDATLDEVAGYNIAKLQSRMERGVIQGSGDNR